MSSEQQLGLEADPVDPYDAATKNYVDGRTPRIFVQETEPDAAVVAEDDIWLNPSAPRFFVKSTAPSSPNPGDVWLDLSSI